MTKAKTTETTEPEAAKPARKRTAKPKAKDAGAAPADVAGGVSDKPAQAAQPAQGKKAKGGATLRDVAEGYLASMEQAGKSEGTLFSYRMELRLALEALGETTPVTKITVADVAGFFASDPVNKTRSGLPKSPLSVAKTQRVLRQALAHAVAEGLIEKAPLPEKA